MAWQHITFDGQYALTRAPTLINVDGIRSDVAQRPIKPNQDDG